MTIAAERAVLAVTRPWIAEWNDVAVAELRPAWRAAALAHAAVLRGAYRDLDPRAVPGVAECAALHAALGCERHQSRLAGDVLVSRVLRSAHAAEPESGAELAHALALEWLVPLTVETNDHPTRGGSIRFGRGDEWVEIDVRGDRERIPLRGRIAIFTDLDSCALPGIVTARGGTRRVLRIVAFGPVTADDRFAERCTNSATRLMRAPPDRCGFAIGGEAAAGDRYR